MWNKIKDFFTSEKTKRKRLFEERLQQDREREAARRERAYQWAKKYIKRWGIWRYRYVFIVENSDYTAGDESTYYRDVYAGNNMGEPDGSIACFHISELFPWKPDEEYYRDKEEE